MTEEQKQPEQMSREEQIKLLLPALIKALPTVFEVAKAYQTAYPVATTPDAVLDAVTVPVPLKTFMLMASITTNLVVIEREKAAKGDGDENTRP